MYNSNEVDDFVFQLKLIRKYLKLKIMEDNITFHGHVQERHNIYDMIKRTILHGESHSAVLIGPTGSGKTTLLNSVLHQLSKEVDMENDAIIIRLNGLIHHDDKHALKSITAQMQLENAVGDRVFGSFAENLAFLLSCLQSGTDRRCRSMVFLLEKCEMFSSRTQMLLYNLFDVTHTQSAPMCVIGITNHLDVIESFEKRVKSRFSHRHICLFPNEVSEGGNHILQSALETTKQVVLGMLSMPKFKRQGGGRRSKKSIRKFTDLAEANTVKYSIPVEVLQRCSIDVRQFEALSDTILEVWNSHVESLVETEPLIDALEKLCYYNVDEKALRTILFQIVCKLSPSKPSIEVTDFISAIDNAVAPSHRVKLLQSLSILELSLVIAMKHGMDIFDGQPMNFEMILHRYMKFANTHSSAQAVPRPVILKAFEHLQDLEIVMPVRTTDSIHGVSDTTASKVQKEYKLFTLACPVSDISEAIKGFKSLPTEINHWYTNSVV